MSLQKVLSARHALTLAAVLLVPSIFLRITSDPFDLIKGTLLWIVGLVLVALTLVMVVAREQIRNFRLEASLAILLVASLIATATSSDPIISIFGQTQRYTGLLTLSSCALIALIIASSMDVRQLGRYRIAHLCALFPILGYGLLQEMGADPFAWSSGSFNKFVFGTMGNPNTASAWVGSTSALLFATYLAIGRERMLVRGIVAFACGISGPMLASFNSFQGQVAALSVWLVALVWATVERRMVRDIISCLLLASAVSVPAQFDVSATSFVASLVVASSAYWFSSQRRVGSRSIHLLKFQSSQMRNTFVGGVVITLTAVAFLFRSRLSSGFRGGFLERGDFFRAARDIFLENPIFGTGLETFGFFFTRFRPASHARLLESSRTSSAHNIFLGMFANGGLVLGLAYLALIGMTAWVGADVFRKRRSDTIFVGVFCSWLTFQIVSLVSVEHVALHLLNFVFIGMIFGYWRLEQSQGASPTRASTRPNRYSRVAGKRMNTASQVVAALLIPAMVIGFALVSKPARSGIKNFDGLERYFGYADVAGAQAELRRATEIYPYDAQNWVYLSEITAEVGDFKQAAIAAEQALRRSHFSGAITGSLWRIQFNAGLEDQALETARRGLIGDPYSEKLLQELGEALAVVAQSSVARGDLARGRELLQELLELLPDYDIQGIEELLQTVGL
jgi:hypothetical protein